MLQIHIANRQSHQAIPQAQLELAVRRVLVGEGVTAGEVSVAVVDDAEMHELNRRHLQHDYPTDVLSFLFDRNGAHLEGELVVSAAMAAIESQRQNWPFEAELLLYAIHGALHLCGYDDQSPEAAAEMRRRERQYLATFGYEPRFE